MTTPRMLSIHVLLLLCIAATDAKPQLSVRLTFPGLLNDTTHVVPLTIGLKTQREFKGEIQVTIPDLPAVTCVAVHVGRGTFTYHVPLGVWQYLQLQTVQPLKVRLVDERGVEVAESAFPIDAVLDRSHAFRRRVLWIARKQITPRRQEFILTPDGLPTDRPATPKFGRGPSFVPISNVTTYKHKEELGRIAVADAPTDWRMYLDYAVIVVSDEMAAAASKGLVDELDAWVRSGGFLVILPSALSSNLGSSFAAQFARPAESEKSICRGLGAYVYADHFKDLRFPVFRASRLQNMKVLQWALHRPHLWQMLRPRLDNGFYYEESGYYSPPGRPTYKYANGLPLLVPLSHLSGQDVLKYMIAFVLLVLACERLVLRFTRRAGLAWCAGIAVALIASWLGLHIHRAVRGFTSAWATCAVHDYGPEGGGVSWTQESFAPATLDGYTFSAKKKAVIFPGSSDEKSAQLQVYTNEERVIGRGRVWQSFPLWSLTAHSLDAPFAADLSWDGKNLYGDVKQVRGPKLQNGVLIWRRKCYNLPTSSEELMRTRSQYWRDDVLFQSERHGYGPEPWLAAYGTTYTELRAHLPQDPNTEYGVILAFGDQGPGLTVDSPTKHVQRHVVRQVVRIKAQ